MKHQPDSQWKKAKVALLELAQKLEECRLWNRDGHIYASGLAEWDCFDLAGKLRLLATGNMVKTVFAPKGTGGRPAGSEGAKITTTYLSALAKGKSPANALVSATNQLADLLTNPAGDEAADPRPKRVKDLILKNLEQVALGMSSGWTVTNAKGRDAIPDPLSKPAVYAKVMTAAYPHLTDDRQTWAQVQDEHRRAEEEMHAGLERHAQWRTKGLRARKKPPT